MQNEVGSQAEVHNFDEEVAASVVTPEDPLHKYKVHKSLEVLLVPIDELLPWAQNPRNGDIEMIAKSLRDHGQFRAIGVNRGTYSRRYDPKTIAYGNHTYHSALQEGWTHIAVTWLDVEDDEFDEIAMVDNAASDAAYNDPALQLAVLQQQGVTPERAGVTEDQMRLMMARQQKENDSPADFSEVDDVNSKHRCPKCGYEWG